MPCWRAHLSPHYSPTPSLVVLVVDMVHPSGTQREPRRSPKPLRRKLMEAEAGSLHHSARPTHAFRCPMKVFAPGQTSASAGAVALQGECPGFFGERCSSDSNSLTPIGASKRKSRMGVDRRARAPSRLSAGWPTGEGTQGAKSRRDLSYEGASVGVSTGISGTTGGRGCCVAFDAYGWRIQRSKSN